MITADGRWITTSSLCDEIGAGGNTRYVLVSIDPVSGLRAPLPGMPPTPPDPATLAGSLLIGLLPTDLTLSPNGQTLAGSTYFHVSACEGGGVTLSDVDGSNVRPFDVPDLTRSLDEDATCYQVVSDLHWIANSPDLAVAGFTFTCSGPAADSQIDVAGIWRLTPDGEATQMADIPVRTFSLSFDATWIALETTTQPDPQMLAYPLAGSDAPVTVVGVRNPQFAP